MKLDILKKTWLDIVFEGRNKTYGAYELRKSNRTTIKAYFRTIFLVCSGAPLIIDLFRIGEEMDRDIKITAIKLPKEEA
jgi:protein TonB